MQQYFQMFVITEATDSPLHSARLNSVFCCHCCDSVKDSIMKRYFWLLIFTASCSVRQHHSHQSLNQPSNQTSNMLCSQLENSHIDNVPVSYFCLMLFFQSWVVTVDSRSG